MSHLSNEMPVEDLASTNLRSGITPIEVWKITLRRRRWVLGFLFASITAGLIYVASATPVFEARATIRVGQIQETAFNAFGMIGEGVFIETPEYLAERIYAEYGEGSANVRRAPPFLKRATPVRGTKAVVELVAVANTGAQATDFLVRIVDQTQVRHDLIFNENRHVFEELLENLDKRRSAFLAQHDEVSAALDQIKRQDPVLLSLLSVERSRIAAMIAEIDMSRVAVGQRIIAPAMVRTERIGEIVVPKRAVAPKRAFVILLAGLFGLVGGVSLVCIIELVSRSRRATSQDKADPGGEARGSDA